MNTTATISPTATASAISATETCTHPKPGKNGYLPPEACDAILLYVPSFGAAIFFTILFGLTTLCHIIQAFIYKKVGVASEAQEHCADKRRNIPGWLSWEPAGSYSHLYSGLYKHDTRTACPLLLLTLFYIFWRLCV
jgi:hypothetical protein